MVIIAVLAAILTAFFPFVGVIFTSSLGAKYLNEDGWKSFAGIMLAGCILLFAFQVITAEMLLSALFSMTGLLLFLQLCRKGFKAEIALSLVALLEAAYALVRTLLFKSAFQQSILDAETSAQDMLLSLMPQQAITPQMNEQIATMTNLMMDLFTATWMIQTMIAIYLAALILRKKGLISWDHARTRFPFETTYVVIAGMVGALVPALRIYGINLLIMIGSLFLIQGIAVIDFVAGAVLRRMRWLTTVLIFIGLLNGFFLFVAAIGLFDVWFNFRKITDREESHENYSD